MDHDLAVSYCLDGLGSAAAARGEPQRAARLFAAAHALREPIGDFMAASFRVDLEAGIALARAAGEETYAAARREGQPLSREQAVEYALDGR